MTQTPIRFTELPEELKSLWALLAVDPRELSPGEIEELKEYSAELVGQACYILGNFPENVEAVRRRRLHKADLSELSRERLLDKLAEITKKRRLDFPEDWSSEISDDFFGPLDWFSEPTIIVELLREPVMASAEGGGA